MAKPSQETPGANAVELQFLQPPVGGQHGHFSPCPVVTARPLRILLIVVETTDPRGENIGWAPLGGDCDPPAPESHWSTRHWIAEGSTGGTREWHRLLLHCVHTKLYGMWDFDYNHWSLRVAQIQLPTTTT